MTRHFIADGQIRAYLAATGWTEHEDVPGLWERGECSVATEPHNDTTGALAALCVAEKRPVVEVLREVRMFGIGPAVAA